MTAAWIEPATFRFVAQNFEHCATAVPKKEGIYVKFVSVNALLKDRIANYVIYGFNKSALFTDITYSG
jgi:hypothetical protein